MNTSTLHQDTIGGAKAWSLWLIGVAFVIMVFVLQTGYAITNGAVAKSLALTITQVGLVGSIYTWVFALSQLFSGAILDKFGTRVMPFACTLVAIGAWIFAHSHGLNMLITAQIITAIGASFGFVGAGFVGGAWFAPIKYGIMFSLVQFFASTSAVIGQVTINHFLGSLSWQELINAIAIITLIVAVIQFIFLKDSVQFAEARKSNHPWLGIRSLVMQIFCAIKQVMSNKTAWINCYMGGVTFGAMLAVGVVWGPRAMMAIGLNQNEANIATSCSWFGLAIGAPIFTMFSDKMQKRKLPMAVGCLCQLIIIGLIMTITQISFAMGAVLLFLWGLAAGGSMIPYALSSDLVKPSLIGTSAALVNAAVFVIAGVLMAVPGKVLSAVGVVESLPSAIPGAHLVATHNDYQWALLIYPIALIVALLLLKLMKETYPSR